MTVKKYNFKMKIIYKNSNIIMKLKTKVPLNQYFKKITIQLIYKIILNK